jgi:hypothetical protein
MSLITNVLSSLKTWLHLNCSFFNQLEEKSNLLACTSYKNLTSPCHGFMQTGSLGPRAVYGIWPRLPGKPSLGVCLATQENTAMNGGSPGKLIQILEFDFGKSYRKATNFLEEQDRNKIFHCLITVSWYSE